MRRALRGVVPPPRRRNPGAALTVWPRHPSPVNAAAHPFVLRGLPERVIAELLPGLQRRSDAGARTRPDALRCLVATSCRAGGHHRLDLDESLIKQTPATTPPSWPATWPAAPRAVGPGTGTGRGLWDLPVLGLRGRLDFTAIAQGWLREAAKAWAAEDLPPPGKAGRSDGQGHRNALGTLSDCLRLSRDDHGEDPGRSAAPTSSRSPTGWRTCSAPGR